MAIEILKELDPMKVEAWDRIHDKRKLYRCERCGAERLIFKKQEE